ncbi:MAG: amidase [Rhodospirillales bacterium]
MADEDLCYMTATEALARFKARTLSPVELLDALIERSKAVEPTVNAFTAQYFDDARIEARKAEERYASDRPARALEGLALAVKDESWIKGKVTTGGSLIHKDFVATSTTPAIQRLMGAGAVVHARTATPEFSCSGVCWSLLHGVTRNPWNPDYTPGGSSGGSSAALAAGTATLASGSDIGGSVRIPASCAGVVGFKPSYGRIPEDPPFNLDTYCHQGPLARSVADAALMFNVMNGPHEQDIASLRPKIKVPTEPGDGVKGWKIAYSMDLGFYEVDAQVRKNTESALRVFQDLGATVEEVDLGWTAEVTTTAMNHLAHIFGAYIESFYDRHAYSMTPYARAFAETARNHPARAYLASLEGAGKMYATFGPIMQRYKAFVCPTLATPAVPADWDQSRDRVEVNGKSLDPWFWLMTYPFNTLSRCPVLAVPSGWSDSAVPTGIQIVGRTYDDIGVIRAGLAYQSAFPLFDSAARRPHI